MSRYPRDEAEYRSVVRRDPCSYCGHTAPWPGTLDHIVPRSAGGSSTAENLAGACPRDNELKGTLDLLVFMLVRVELCEREQHDREQRRRCRARRKRARRQLRESAAPHEWMTAQAA
jgi:hypothetical protein